MNQPIIFNPSALQASPLFEPLLDLLKRIGPTLPGLGDLNVLLAEFSPVSTQSGKPIRFVEQAPGKLAFEAQHEPRCFLTGEVQTRENNLHDFFNALVWLTFPQSKAAINARHFRALTDANSTLQTQRGNVRDMATLFDESGVIVASADENLSSLLRDFGWKELFWSHREDVAAKMGFYIFGHGLHEKAITPYVGMTGQGLVLQVEADFFDWPMPRRMRHVDECVANYLNEPSHCQSTRELTPVPLLGIPGWSSDNEREEYYDNREYFRSGRRC